MQNKITKTLVATMAFIGFSVAQAGDIVNLQRRCAEDSLNTAQATERNYWAIKCAQANGGGFHGLSKNKFLSFMFETDFETNQVVKKSRPEYPIFTDAGLTKVWKAPAARAAACTVPGGYTITGACTSSCYTGDQEILFSDGYLAIEQAFLQKKQEIIVLSEQSTLNDISLRIESVDSYTQSVNEKAINTILTFKTKFGEDLRVTENHPLVKGNGKIVRADSLKVGDELVSAEGEPQEIVSISSKVVEGYVYNVQPTLQQSQLGGTDVSGQIVIAQGYLSGSSYLQNDGVKYLENFTIRQKIPAELL